MHRQGALHRFATWFLWWFLWSVYAVVAQLWFRPRYLGHPVLPRRGPVLVLMNHVSFLDPAWMAWPTLRRVHYMATASLFEVPFVGGLVRLLGAFPKAKYVKDASAMKTMVELLEAGEVVGLFPEGQRTWDGRTSPILPGIGRILKKHPVPVVFVRNRTGHLFQPRWAVHRRWVPVHIEYDAPTVFPADMAAADIEAEIQRRITLDVERVEVPWGSFGRRLAQGLRTYVWACPSCWRLDGLAVEPADEDVVRCGGCGAAWRLDLRHHMHPLGEEEALTVAEAGDRVQRHFGEPPVVDRARFEAGGVAIECPRALVRLVVKGKGMSPVGEGRLVLTAERLALVDASGEELWGSALAEVQAVSVEVASRLQVRLASGLFDLDPLGESTLKWDHFLRGHLARSRRSRRARGATERDAEGAGA